MERIFPRMDFESLKQSKHFSACCRYWSRVDLPL